MNHRHIFITGIFLVFLTISPAQNNSKLITVEDIYQDYIFYPKKINSFKFLEDGMHYSTLENFNSIWKYDCESGNMVTVLFTTRGSDISSISDYEFSRDEKYILLTTEKRQIYRHSFSADFYVYSVVDKKLIPLSKNEQLKMPAFSPDGSKIAFVRENNLYITDLASMNEEQTSFDGKKNSVINGAPDWVYEEEFALTKGFTWSPDSRKLAFYRFDESNVKEFSLIEYGDLYPETYTYKYPKAGEQNTIVSIHVYDLNNRKTTKMDTGDETDQYIPRIAWTKNPEILSIIRLNRLQNQMDVLHANPVTGNSEPVYTEKNVKYISEMTDQTITYLADEKHFIIRSERNGWFQLYLYNYLKKTIKPITTGEFDVSACTGFDEASGTVYYISHEISVIQQDLFAVSVDGRNKTRISTRDGWNIPEFSNDYRFYINNHSSANQPDYISLHRANGKLIHVLEDNKEAASKMKAYDFSKIEFIKVPAGSNPELNGFIIKPPEFDASEKYPLIMFVYGGPESQVAVDKFRYENNWFQMLAQKGYIVVCVDGRGTDSRGEAFRKSVYMNLGKYETIDQMEAARYFGNLAYVDRSRIGIYGWSYGGFISLLCLEKGADLFKMAISVAPVTHWRFYDTIYTERFMRTPSENKKGYEENAPLNYTENIKGKLLLVHGMKDDNVHMQNSAELIRKLVLNNIRVDLMLYPNSNHSIREGNASVHLYKKMTDFILENL